MHQPLLMNLFTTFFHFVVVVCDMDSDNEPSCFTICAAADFLEIHTCIHTHISL